MKFIVRLKKNRYLSRHRLSGKLVFLFLSMAIVFVVLVGYGIRQALHKHFENDVRPHIVKYMEYVQKDLGSPPDPQRAERLANELGIEIDIINQKQQWSSHHRKININDIKTNHSHLVNGQRYDLVTYEDREYLMTKSGNTTLLFGIPSVRPDSADRRGIAPIIILLAVLLVLYLMTRRLFAPIDTIEQGVKRIGQGELDHRIQVNRRDELGVLAESINTMANEIQQMLDAKRQLLLAISHELRSPLTRAKVATELLDNAEQKNRINDDLDEMESLIEEILETERLSSRHSSLNKTQQNISTLIEHVKESSFPDSHIGLELPSEPILANIDAPRITLLLKNLIDNAIRHSTDAPLPPKVSLTTEQDKITIAVADSGKGIEEKHLPHLTEPFYRADPSRQRETGGYGLGLYLCKMIAQAHGGSLTIQSKPGTGTTVFVELPLVTYIRGRTKHST